MKVFFINSQSDKPLPSFDFFATLSKRIELSTLSEDEAKESSEVYQADVLVLNKSISSVLKKYKEANSSGQAILVTECPFQEYATDIEDQGIQNIDQVIAYNNNIETTVDLIRVTIQKLLENEVFGIEKYLKPKTLVQEIQVAFSGQREAINSKIQEFAESFRIGTYKSKLIYGISEELLMNAIYDAPASVDEKHPEKPKPPFPINPNESRIQNNSPVNKTYIRFGCDGNLFAIGITDPYGGLTKNIFMRYVQKIVKRHEPDELIDTKESGAGLGIFRILYSSHGVICNVSPNQQTEVIVLIQINEPIKNFEKMNRTIQYFSVPKESTNPV